MVFSHRAQGWKVQGQQDSSAILRRSFRLCFQGVVPALAVSRPTGEREGRTHPFPSKGTSTKWHTLPLLVSRLSHMSPRSCREGWGRSLDGYPGSQLKFRKSKCWQSCASITMSSLRALLLNQEIPSSSLQSVPILSLDLVTCNPLFDFIHFHSLEVSYTWSHIMNGLLYLLSLT